MTALWFRVPESARKEDEFLWGSVAAVVASVFQELPKVASDVWIRVCSESVFERGNHPTRLTRYSRL